MEPIIDRNKLVLKNQKCVVTYDPTEMHIDCTDLEDQWNIPRMYTTKHRSHRKAWDDVLKIFNEDTKMGDIIDIMIKNNMGPRTYCAMD